MRSSSSFFFNNFLIILLLAAVICKTKKVLSRKKVDSIDLNPRPQIISSFQASHYNKLQALLKLKESEKQQEAIHIKDTKAGYREIKMLQVVLHVVLTHRLQNESKQSRESFYRMNNP
jgi:hypothetical protein